MDRRTNDPKYQLHEPPQPPGDAEEERLSAEEFRRLSVEAENSPGSVQQRQHMNQAAPSEVRKNTPAE
ncbi:hypothetical protein BH23GEM7_BH23GEM7_36250 [soil metagenome]